MSSYLGISSALTLILAIFVSRIHASPPYDHRFGGSSPGQVSGPQAPGQQTAYGPSAQQQAQYGPILQQQNTQYGVSGPGVQQVQPQYGQFAPDGQQPLQVQPQYRLSSQPGYGQQQQVAQNSQYSGAISEGQQQQQQFVPIPQQYDVASQVEAQPQLQPQPQVLSNSVSAQSVQQPTAAVAAAQQPAPVGGIPVAPLPTNGWFGAAQMAPPPVPTRPPPLSEPYYTFAEGTSPGICAYGFPPPTYSTPSKKCVPYHPACGLFFTCILDV
uniref:Uncharacterized protein n=1 Tax=Ditylenchus dipsaci TaxID=166011 RepID=A0A915CLK3_9BILA